MTDIQVAGKKKRLNPGSDASKIENGEKKEGGWGST